MIVVKLMGGLGNQMFQCAFGRSRTLGLKTKLILDTSFLEQDSGNHSYRTFSLDKFKITQEIEALNFRFTPRKDNFVDIIKSLVSGVKRLYYIKEKDFTFDSYILDCKNNSYFDGYWQSYKYFENIRSTILDDFKFNFTLSQSSSAILNKIKTVNSVSVHVRRGDYVSNMDANKYHGVCGLSYYESAIKMLRQTLSSPVFFIFSDDPVWVIENISMQNDIVVVSNPELNDPHTDLLLMTSCNHAIVANSSFSWWGAWLIENPDKKIIAPVKWFSNPDNNTIDLIPENWLRI